MNRFHVLLALSWYHPKIHRGIAKFAGEHHWHLASDMVLDQKLPWQWQGDGVICSLVRERQLTTTIEQLNVPTVVVGNSTEGLDCSFFHEDNQAIGTLAAEFFLNKGFRHFAFFWLQPHSRGFYFEQKLQEYGYSVYSLIPNTSETDQRSLQQWLRTEVGKLPKPLAIFAPDDGSASEIIAACEDAQIRIPEDVAVLGVHNDEIICENLSITLSSIDNDFERQGYEAAQLLHRLMKGQEIAPERHPIPPLKVVERQSTDMLAYRNEALVQALHFISHHFNDFIDVSDVCAAVETSRRTLYSLFQHELGRTPSDEITRQRLLYGEQLLAETHLTIQEVSRTAGFNDYRVFHRHFKAKHQCTPTQWRKEARNRKQLTT